MDQEGRRARRLGGIVARHASIVAVMRGRRALYPQCEIELADLVRGGLPRLQRPAVLQPSDFQGWIALADRAGHVHPRARLDIAGKAKRIDFRRYCKLQEAREFISHRNVVRSSASSSSSSPASRRKESREEGILENVFSICRSEWMNNCLRNTISRYLAIEKTILYVYSIIILNYFQVIDRYL